MAMCHMLKAHRGKTCVISGDQLAESPFTSVFGKLVTYWPNDDRRDGEIVNQLRVARKYRLCPPVRFLLCKTLVHMYEKLFIALSKPGILPWRLNLVNFGIQYDRLERSFPEPCPKKTKITHVRS